jgi:uncharacterized membrane protein YeaQ/YmgE (transglycosylase-associated protein family)
MDILIVAIIAGAIGGNIAARILPKFSFGTLGNSVAGIIGGGIGAQILTLLGGANLIAAAGSGLNLASIIASLITGIVGGAVLLAIFGLIRSILR